MRQSMEPTTACFSRPTAHGSKAPGWLRFSFSLGTGTFSGRYRDYNTWTEIDFSGVVLQDYNVAAGCFPGWDQSGEVWLQSQ